MAKATKLAVVPEDMDSLCPPSTSQSQKSTLAIALEEVTKDALFDITSAMERCPEDWFGIPGLSFAPESRDNFHMMFVFCTDKLSHLSPTDSKALQQRLLDAFDIHSTDIKGDALTCRGLELFGHDRTQLIARFRADSWLVQIRRSIWRACREFGVAYPDAMWFPYIQLGKLKGSRSQLNQVTYKEIPLIAINATRLTLLGKRPKNGDWHALNFKSESLGYPPSKPSQVGTEQALHAALDFSSAPILSDQGDSADDAHGQATAVTAGEILKPSRKGGNTKSQLIWKFQRPTDVDDSIPGQATSPPPEDASKENRHDGLYKAKLPSLKVASASEQPLWNKPTGGRSRLAAPI